MAWQRQQAQSTHSTDGGCNRNEGRVVRLQLAVDAPKMLQVDLCHSLGVGGLHDELKSHALANLDVSHKDVRVAKAFIKRGESHDLWDGAEVENGLVAKQGKVFERIDGMLHDIQRHFGKCIARFRGILLLPQIRRLVNVFAPDGFRPEQSTVVHIFSEVPQDVGLLQTETHGVGKGKLEAQLWSFKARGAEKHGQTFADEAGDIVAVKVKVLMGLEGEQVVVIVSQAGVVSHAEAHLAADGGNDLAVSAVVSLSVILEGMRGQRLD